MRSSVRLAKRPPAGYLNRPLIIHFSASEPTPETRRHFELRTALFQILQAAFGDRAVLGSEQFVYYRALDPRGCCAPDVMLRFGEPDAPFELWKVWERGAPQLAIEVLSKTDKDILTFAEKLERYREMGVLELVCFDFDTPEQPIRIWDRLKNGDLGERDRSRPNFTKSKVVPGYWRAFPEAEPARALRLSHSARGTDSYLTPAEQFELERAKAEAKRKRAELKRKQAETERKQAETGRKQAETERKRAEARVVALEAELARLRAKRP